MKAAKGGMFKKGRHIRKGGMFGTYPNLGQTPETVETKAVNRQVQTLHLAELRKEAEVAGEFYHQIRLKGA